MKAKHMILLLEKELLIQSNNHQLRDSKTNLQTIHTIKFVFNLGAS